MLQVILDFGVLKIGQWSLPLRVHAYGLMMVLGFLTGIVLAKWRAKRAGEDAEKAAACCVLSLVGGIVGARAAYVIQHWEDEFAFSPNRLGAVVNITSGGLIYYGGVVLAIVLVVGYLLARRLPVRRYLDFLAISLMVGLAFGRTGCLLNGCCYGGLCRHDWPLAMRFPMYSKPLLKLDGRANPYSRTTEGPTPPYSHHREAGWIRPDPALVDSAGFLIPPRDFDQRQTRIAETSHSLPVQPAQALAIVNALLIAAVLWGFYRLRRREGQVFAAMLVLYSIARFILEGIRDDNPHDLLAGVLTHNQYTSVVTFLAGVLMLAVIWKLPASAGPAAGAHNPPAAAQADAGARRQDARDTGHKRRRGK